MAWDAESSAFPERAGRYGTACCFHPEFPALSDPGKALCSAGMRSLGGGSQHSEAEVMLQHFEGALPSAVLETEAVAVRDAVCHIPQPR